jgi:hypothetical protein
LNEEEDNASDRIENLAQYLSFSGFGSLDDWWTKIRSFGACDGWLFVVRAKPVSSFITPERLS